jgi:hypothetical protein
MTVRRTLAYSFLTSGILFGGLGTYLDSITLARTGLLFAVLSIPLYARMYHELRQEEIQQAETAGYMRALDHVARGLLDQNTHGEPGPGDNLDTRPDNVIPLNADAPIWHDDGHRKERAQ